MLCMFRLCILCIVCKCALFHCHRVSTQLQLNISYIIYKKPEAKFVLSSDHTEHYSNNWLTSHAQNTTDVQPIVLVTRIPGLRLKVNSTLEQATKAQRGADV
jgi:hypothetical protein